MIDLALDPSETREMRIPAAPPRRAVNLRIVLFGLAGIGVLGGFGVAASTLMAGLAAPTPIKVTAAGRAADWPDLKDGLPAVAGSIAAAAPEGKPAEPVVPAPRMAALPDTFTPAAGPIKASPASQPARAADTSVPPTRRIPTPTSVVPLTASRQVVPLPPSRTAALQAPRASETVRAHALAEPATSPVPKPVAATAASPEKTAKPAPMVVAAKPAPTKTAEKAKHPTSATVAQAEATEPEETEVLGIKLPSLAPAGRKLKESVDALGDAVKSVF